LYRNLLADFRTAVLCCENRSHPFHQAAAEVALDPIAVVSGTVFMVLALNCSPCSLSLTHQPLATSHPPAVTEGRDPMTVVSSRCPCVFTRRMQKPFSSLWKVTPLDHSGKFFGRRSAFRARGIHGVGTFSHRRYMFRPVAVPPGRSTDEDDTYRDNQKFRTSAKIVRMLKAIGNSPKLRGLLSIAGTSPGFRLKLKVLGDHLCKLAVL
jgi:hypothetical protein